MANTTNIDLVKPAGTDHALISVINSNMDKIDAEAGRQRGNFAGTYSTTSGYAVGDYCIYQGNLYRCTTAIGSSGENWTAAHWTQTKAGTELKGLSDQIGNVEGVTSSDLDTIATGKLEVKIYNANTLHSPYKESITGAASGIVFSYAVDNSYGVQLSLAAASYNFFIRRLTGGTWGAWQKVVPTA